MKIINYENEFIYKDFKTYLRHKEPTKKHKPTEYKKFFACFDTETSETTHDINSKNYFSFIMLWQFNFMNEMLIYGRSVQSFVDFIRYLKSALNRDLAVFVHNLSYEFQFLKFYFSWDNIFFIQPRKVYRAKTGNIIFKDSYALSGQSLEKTVEKYPIKKAVGKWDYNKIRTPKTVLTDDELLYAFNDVTSLYYYIDDMRRHWGVINRIPMTKTGITRTNLREYLNRYYKNYNTSLKSGYEYYYNYFLKNCIPNLDLYKVLRAVYWGGFTHANLYNSHKVLKNVVSYDICSSYPTVMLCEKYPYKFYKKPVQRFNYYISHNYAVLALYRFINLKSKINMGYIPTYKAVTYTDNFIYDNGKFYTTYGDESILDIWLTEQDLQTIKNIYDYDDILIISDYIYISKKEYLPDGFREFVLKLYADKTELKGVKGRADDYARAKADLNSLYGMTVTAPVRTKYKLEKREVIEDTSQTDAEQLDDFYKQKRHPIGLYQWGVYIAAYARRNLLKVIEKINPRDFVYSDTDSIKVLNGEKYQPLIDNYNAEITLKLQDACKNLKYSIHPKTKEGKIKPLGIYEKEWTAKKFKCLRAKTYIYTVNNELNATVAGATKKDVETRLKKLAIETGKDVYNIFTDDFYIPADELTKLTAMYDDDSHETIVDGCKVSAESCTTLLDVDFTLIKNDYYLRIIQEIQGYSGKII